VQWLHDGIVAQYVGEMREGKRNGKGVFTSANGDRYDGEWQDDKRNGKGVAISPKGDHYEGEWRDDRPHGSGDAVIQGVHHLGKWVDGCFKDGDRRGSAERPLSECP